MNTTFYFKHDYNARNDEKTIKLRKELGAEGYGVYFMLLEILGAASCLKLSLNSLETIAWELNLDFKLVQNVVLNFDLFKKNEEFFWSERILKHRLKVQEKSESAKESADTRWTQERENLEKIKKSLKHKNLIPLFQKFLKNRSSKAKNTAEAIEVLVEKVNSLTEEKATVALKGSIGSGWTGIFPEKKEEKKVYDPLAGHTGHFGIRNY